MRTLNLTCSWCEIHALQLNENGHGFYVGCSESGDRACPDTTGTFTKAEDAIQCAKEFNGKS